LHITTYVLTTRRSAEDDSLVVWTNRNPQRGSHIVSIHADPEIVKNMTDHKGNLDLNALVTSNYSRTEYWAVAADYSGKRIFYTDRK